MKIVATVLLGPGTADSVGEAIRTAAPYADEFAFIHSGGQEDLDAAVDVALELRKPSFTLLFDWTGSYADARNYALEQADMMSATWALTVDTDERLDLLGDPAKVRESLEQDPDVTVVEAQCRDEGYWKERFIRLGTPGLEWRGRSCEVLEREGKTARLSGAKFWELPKTPEQLKARQERGVANMPAEIERDPKNPRWYRHMASCLKGLGRHEESMVPAEKAIDLFQEQDKREPEGWTRYMLCESLCATGELDSAYNEASIGLARHAGMLPEFGSVLAYVEYKRDTQQSRQNASRWAQLVLVTPEDRTRSFFRSNVCKQNAYQVLHALHPDLEEKRFASQDYARREAFRSDYDIFAAAILEHVPLDSRVSDFGAGQGFLIDALDRQGYTGEAYGCELEESARDHASEWAKDRVSFGCDMRKWCPSQLGTVFCLEVLEHMPGAEAHNCVRSLCKASSGLVVFSAAHPGQGGHGHVNEQPKDYWLKLFRRHGFDEDDVLTRRVANACADMKTCHWLPENLMIFRRAE